MTSLEMTRHLSATAHTFLYTHIFIKSYAEFQYDDLKINNGNSKRASLSAKIKKLV